MTRKVSLSLVLLLTAGAALLSGCGGGGGGGGFEPDPPPPPPPPPPPDEVNIDYSQLEPASLQTEPLVAGEDAEVFAEYLKNGIRLRLAGRNAPVALADDGAAADEASGDYSSTNVHVAGVDEADRVKYDGEFIYVSGAPQYFYIADDVAGVAEDDGFAPVPESRIRILRTDPDSAAVSEVSTITVDDPNTPLSQLYLVGDGQGGTSALASVGNTVFYTWDAALVEPGWTWSSGKTRVELFDVSNPYDPQSAWTLEIEGNLEGSRKIGEVLYLITRYVPNLPELDFGAASDEDREANEQRILDAPLSALLPHQRIDDGEVRALLESRDCFVPENIDEHVGYADIITVTAVDLAARSVLSSACLNVQLNGIYSSQESLYLGGSHGAGWSDGARQTALHKFALNGGQVEYRGSAAVPGFIGWQDPAFRMDEYQGELRIVTTESTFSGEPLHRLSVLRERAGSNALELVAQLPNESRPEPIGKPREDIYAVRFMGPRAFIVTFERIDPLYVLDLADGSDPRIAGELEVPGYSSYLHPVDERYLLSIGQEVDERLRPTSVKVELFDIGDISRPLSLERHLIGERGSWTEALYDLRAISFLRHSDDQLRFAFPVMVHDTAPKDLPEDEPAWYEWSYTGLHLFEVNGLAGMTASLDFVGPLVSERRDDELSYPSWSNEGRSVLHDEAVYYLPGDRVWAGFWSSPEQANGPF